eukprot:1537978-Prymnesium_polylepis.1
MQKVFSKARASSPRQLLARTGHLVLALSQAEAHETQRWRLTGAPIGHSCRMVVPDRAPPAPRQQPLECDRG